MGDSKVKFKIIRGDSKWSFEDVHIYELTGNDLSTLAAFKTNVAMWENGELEEFPSIQ